MFGGDGYEFLEECCFFYVVFICVWKMVMFVMVECKELVFVFEFVKDFDLVIYNVDGIESLSLVCLKCGIGFEVLCKGCYGFFFGCLNYLCCDYMWKVFIGQD